MTDTPASSTPVRIVSLYRFAPFDDCGAIRTSLARLCAAEDIKGTLLLAREGINGTIAGTDAAIDRVLRHVRALPGCAELQTSESRADTLPFYRMKVRIRREIVTMGEPAIDPRAGTGRYVEPEDWNALIAQEGTILIDTRNDYEVAIGSFAGAIDPQTPTFRDFPSWFRANRDALTRKGPPRIAMFCTGGIRCEKATAFVAGEGFGEVFHLRGGILNYLDRVPAEQSLWQGECFVFDQRATVVHGLLPGTAGLCHACRMPVSVEDQASPLYSDGISCPACHAQRDDGQRARYAERRRQMRLAEARGERHVGATNR